MGFVLSYRMGIGLAVALCLSAIIGDTLFVFTGVPITEIGANSIMAYVIVGIIAIIIAMQLGELSSIMPHEKGGPYSYVTKSFGSELGFVTGILLFIGYCAIVAAVTLGFGSYFLSLFGLGGTAAHISIAIVLIIAISIINMRGVKSAVELNKMLIAITLLTAALFFIFAVFYGHDHGSLATNFIGSAAQNMPGAFFQAITAIVFAFAGFQIIVTLTDNVKGLGKGVTRAMVYAILISIVAYIAITFGLLMMLRASSFTITSEPLLYALSSVHAPSIVVILVDFGTLFAIAASVIAIIFTASRLFFQIGNDGLLPGITRRFDRKRGVATSGVVMTSLVSIMILFSGNLYTILSISNFGMIFSWLMSCFAVINMRRRKKIGEYSSPYYPYLTMVGIIACLIFIFGLPSISLAIGVIVLLFLILVYYIIVEIKYREVPRVRLFD
ncbi:MAG: APC family permease [Candidatus Marsarchaeota archaeon]|nr:APC family permease [Candidatus Marsarchaeota archaeon]MCL5413262.1 APC family permease [Candidatus Marsarchaeota archaeon]